jgi:hypothetical protein
MNKLQKIADKECKYLEIIKIYLMKTFNLNEEKALINGLDLLDYFKIMRLL